MKIRILLFFLLAPALSFSQIIDNKLNIELGGGISMPLNSSVCKDGDFQYPSLWGNFPAGAQYSLEAIYKINQKIWLGANINQTGFKGWSYSANDLFLLANPTTSIFSYNLVGYYFPESHQLPKKFFTWGMLAGGGLNSYHLKWGDFIAVDPNQTDYGYSSTFTDVAFSIGFLALKDFNNDFGMSVKAKYGYGFTNSEYFVDGGLHTFQVTCNIYYRLFLNKYFIYD